RSADDSKAASRTQDSFALELTWFQHNADQYQEDQPEQRQYNAVRYFVDYLRQIELADIADTPENLAAFDQAVRDLIPNLLSPPQSTPHSPPDHMVGSPPSWLQIPATAIVKYMRRAFQLWTTEVRPAWLGKNQDCIGNPPDTQCVMLAQINVTLTPDGQAADSPKPEVDETLRPYLLSLQFLQEWLLSHMNEAVTLHGDANGPSGSNTVTGLRGVGI